MNWRFISRHLGLLLLPFSLCLLVPALWDGFRGYWEVSARFMEAAGIGALISTALFFLGSGAPAEFNRRESLLIVSLTWILASIIGALPFYFLQFSSGGLADAIFESMSGLTTTGATVLTVIEGQPMAVLLWRSMLHFIGGLGIVVLFAVFFPLPSVGGKSIYNMEVAGPFEDVSTPRIRDTAIQIAKIYVGLNILETILLWIAGMTLFEAANHSMATIATGGFSTRDASVYSFHSPTIEWIIIVFMFLAGTNFILHAEALRRNFAYFKDPEFLVYLLVTIGGAFVAAAIIKLSGSAMQSPTEPGVTPYVSGPGFPIRDTLFMIFSVGTSTGFGTVDYDGWPAVVRLYLLLLMISGACAGSTSGGLKMIRWIVSARIVTFELTKSARPREVRRLRLGDKVLSERQVRDIIVFTICWLAIIVVNASLVALLSPDKSLMTSLSATITTMSNIGPGLEGVGPTDNYGHLSSAVKYVLTFNMLVGRLEIFPLLAILSPRFWRR